MARTKRKNKSSKLNIQKRWCTETKTENNMDISEHNSNVSQLSSGDSIFKNERVSMQEKSVLEQENVADTYDGPSYIIVDKNALCDIFKYTFCGSCNQSTLKLEFGRKYGFSHQLKLVCKTCSEQKMECFTSPTHEKKSNTSTPFDVNVRAVQAFLEISGGHASVEKFCMFFNMPLIVQNAYRKLDQNGSNTITDIAVPFDGTGLTRGHTSQIGIECVVGTLTGYVIDYEIMSKYCSTCISAKNELGETTAEYDVWYSGHKNYCQINHVGTSGAMKMKAAAKIWSRSESCGFRYTTLLSDGDAITHKFLNSLKIYRPDVEILKEECINHVSKRLGTSLRNLVKDWRAKGITLGGKSYGSLKETTIKKLTQYYQKAILENKGDIQGMKKSIYATLYHSISTDKNPMHMKCPPGKDSWCFYRRALAKGEKPAPHKFNTGTPIHTDY
ncbi:uncharacterized protein TNCV_759851 [Trichonephila clavipes]|nr:uncharacterized protein TNCV_759851 [Trichonephila clavipes]